MDFQKMLMYVFLFFQILFGLVFFFFFWTFSNKIIVVELTNLTFFSFFYFRDVIFHQIPTRQDETSIPHIQLLLHTLMTIQPDLLRMRQQGHITLVLQVPADIQHLTKTLYTHDIQTELPIRHHLFLHQIVVLQLLLTLRLLYTIMPDPLLFLLYPPLLKPGNVPHPLLLQ